jgi:hypothetical protein
MKINLLDTFLEELDNNAEKGLVSAKPKEQQKKAMEILFDFKNHPEHNISHIIHEIRGFMYEDFEELPIRGIMRSCKNKYGRNYKNKGN